MKLTRVLTVVGLCACSLPSESGVFPEAVTQRITIVGNGVVPAFDSVSYHAKLAIIDTSLVYTWEIDGLEYIGKSPSLTTVFYVTGEHRLICTALRSDGDSVIAKDTLNITVVPRFSLDFAKLQTMKKVLIQYEAAGREQLTEGGRISYGTRTGYGLTLPLASKDMLSWNDSGAYFATGERVRDTSMNAGNPVYSESEFSQHVSITIEGSKLISLHMRRLDYSSWSEGGTVSMNLNLNEFKVRELELYAQSEDTVVLAQLGPSLSKSFKMNSKEWQSLEPNPYFRNGREFLGLSPTSNPPRCFVTFFK